jgi:hypothetical protein
VNYYYHPDARQEASAAVAHYAGISLDFGIGFLAELENSIERILGMPEAWAKYWKYQTMSPAPLSLRDRLSDRTRTDSDCRSHASSS